MPLQQTDGGDYTVHFVVGLDPEGRMYLLDRWRKQSSSDEILINELLEQIVLLGLRRRFQFLLRDLFLKRIERRRSLDRSGHFLFITLAEQRLAQMLAVALDPDCSRSRQRSCCPARYSTWASMSADPPLNGGRRSQM
jgi:hypothetical protein